MPGLAALAAAFAGGAARIEREERRGAGAVVDDVRERGDQGPGGVGRHALLEFFPRGGLRVGGAAGRRLLAVDAHGVVDGAGVERPHVGGGADAHEKLLQEGHVVGMGLRVQAGISSPCLAFRSR